MISNVQPSEAEYLGQTYDDFERIEAAFGAALDESLDPRGPDSLYEIVAKLGLPAGSTALDLGCGEGQHSLELAKRFGFTVVGVDPVARHVELADAALAEAVKELPELAERVSFERGSAQALTLADASIDLIWCREVLVLIDALDAVFAECRRVLRNGGRMLILDTYPTQRLEASELEGWWSAAKTLPAGAQPALVEAAFTAAGFAVESRVEFASEWGEYGQERAGVPGRRLLHAARLLRDPERYIARFGRAAYDIMLSDCLWHVYRMIGKLSGRVYLLKIRSSS
jgi:SAM-dependent methyltransferase